MYNQEDFKKHYSQFEQWCQNEGYEDIEDLQKSCSKKTVADERALKKSR